jgi:hypothetical protein
MRRGYSAGQASDAARTKTLKISLAFWIPSVQIWRLYRPEFNRPMLLVRWSGSVATAKVGDLEETAMKRDFLSTLIASIAVLAVWGAVPLAQAGVNSDTISIHFAVEEPKALGGSMLFQGDIAGVVPSDNWNSAMVDPSVAQSDYGSGFNSGLTRDTNGVAVTTNASVFWHADGAWSSTGRGEENNNFDPLSADHTLMSGYLDHGHNFPSPTVMVISNLPSDIATGTYDVYVLALGGVSNRGGQYTCNNSGPLYLLAGGPSSNGPFTGPTYVQAKGDDPNYGSNDYGNYLVFPNQTGGTIAITSTQYVDGGSS